MLAKMKRESKDKAVSVSISNAHTEPRGLGPPNRFRGASLLVDQLLIS